MSENTKTPSSTSAPAADAVDENKLIAERRAKLDKLRGAGANGFPNDFRRDALARSVADRLRRS